MGVDHKAFRDPMVSNIPQLTCTLCQQVHWKPTETPCGHVFCYSCICRRIQDTQQCGECGSRITSIDFVRPSNVVQNMLNPFIVSCRSCEWQGKYQDLFNHPCSQKRSSSAPMFQQRLNSLRASHDNSSVAPSPGIQSFGSAPITKDEPLIDNAPKPYRAQQYRSSPHINRAPQQSYNPQPSYYNQNQAPKKEQFSFPAISMDSPSYSTKRICRGCGGEGNFNEINGSSQLCRYCEKY